MKIQQIISKSTITKKFLDIVNESSIEYDSIYLFGSRASANFRDDSDWDFLVVVKKDIEEREKKEYRSRLRMIFHDYFPFNPIDIIIKDLRCFEEEKHIINTISNEAFTEGIKL
ncbi:MAG: nucleotidyltransferase domain-containing protein [Planctomycetes bacterium]|nr:nucleotidyltransferase domain-containing protein [Planctomycetota bacterium]